MQIETNLKSLGDINQLLQNQFQDYLLQQTNENTSEKLAILLKEIESQNSIKKKQLLTQQQKQNIYIENEKQQLDQNINQEKLINILETKQSLDQNYNELKKSINHQRKSLNQQQDYKNQLGLQLKQAEQEYQIADFELNKIKQMTCDLQNSMKRLRFQRQQYKDHLCDQSSKINIELQTKQQEFDEQTSNIESLIIKIKQQKKQIEELNQQKITKFGQCEQQGIVIQNLQSLIKLYECCQNSMDQLQISQDQSSDSESINEIHNYTEEDSVITNNFFQTQIHSVKASSSIKQSSQIAKSVQNKNKKPQNKLVESELIKKLQDQKQILSLIRTDVNIQIMEEAVLSNFNEQAEQQRQLTEQHNLLLEQKNEYLQELLLLNENYEQDDYQERLIECIEKTNDNFNNSILTKNMINTSTENSLQIQRLNDELMYVEKMFFTLNSKAMSLLKRICQSLTNIHHISDKIDNRVLQVYQNALITVGLLKQNNELKELIKYPQLQKLIKNNNITLLYCDSNILAQFCENKTDEELCNNFYQLLQNCMIKMADETKFIYEQITTICNFLRSEVRRLCNYGSLRSFRDLANIQNQSIGTYNVPTSRRIIDETNSKISEISSSKKQQSQEFQFDNEQNEKSLNEDDIDEFYHQVKKELESKPSQTIKRDENGSQCKTTTIYEQPNRTPMTQFLRQNSKFSVSLRRIQSQGCFSEGQTKNFKLFLEKEQKNIELLSRMNRTGSTSAFQTVSQRPITQEKPTTGFQQRSTTAAQKKRQQIQKGANTLILQGDKRRFQNKISLLKKLEVK